ncbi:glycosyltransferase family 4 protein [Agaribacterium sp. ZY112]|uniref:glycosyltransferase family 4 protein n=1 Tax=Agaribacterium sp. ZY112 TaxID=3233574 RepID=UPI00352515E5
MNSTTHINTKSIAPKSKALRIALLGYRSDPFVGGQGIYLHYLSRALTEQGHHLTVFSGPPYPVLDKGIRLIKVPSLDLYAKEKPLRSLRLKHLLSFTDLYEWWSKLSGSFAEPYCFGRRINKLIHAGDFDIVHDNQSLASALLNLEKKGLKVVSTIHHPIHRDRDIALAETDDKGWRTLIKRWYSFLSMQEKVALKLKHIITVSQQSQEDINTFFQRPHKQTKVIFNGVDTELFKPGAEQNSVQLQTAPSLLVTSSSDQALKGIKSLFEALALLVKNFPSLTLHMVGELKKGGANEKLLNTLQLQNHIIFHQRLSTEELVQLYNQSTVVVCPSIYEGFGLPAAEAMACGRAIVSSDGGALPEVIGQAGLIYKAGDSPALAKSIKRLLQDQELRTQLEKKARLRAVSTFSWQQVAHELNHYYQHQVMALD